MGSTASSLEMDGRSIIPGWVEHDVVGRCSLIDCARNVVHVVLSPL